MAQDLTSPFLEAVRTGIAQAYQAPLSEAVGAMAQEMAQSLISFLHGVEKANLSQSAQNSQQLSAMQEQQRAKADLGHENADLETEG